MTKLARAEILFCLLIALSVGSLGAIAEPQDKPIDQAAGPEAAKDKDSSDPDKENMGANAGATAEEPEKDEERTGANAAINTETEDPKPAAASSAKPANELSIATWGGAYAESQKIAYFDPFTKETGVKIMQATHGGGLDMLRARLKSEETPWDVIDLSLQTVDQACELGLLEQIDHDGLKDAPDGTSAKIDFLPDGLRKCGVASVAWAVAIVYDKRKFTKSKPKSARDLFNLKRFPGNRSMRRGPKLNLELALLADGVPPSEVYNELETEDGVDRALKTLEKLRDNIVWWDRGDEPLQNIIEGKATMATAYNGRIFSTIAGKQQPLGIIWDGQIYDIDLWAIPKNARNKERALEFVSFATQTDRLAHQTKWFPYGPMRKSAVQQIGEHAEAGLKMAPYIPTVPENFKNALRVNEAWWAKHRDRIKAKFDIWIAGPQLENSDASGDAKPDVKSDTRTPDQSN